MASTGPAPLILIGAGGFGQETVEVVHAINERRPQWNPCDDVIGSYATLAAGCGWVVA